MPFSVAIGVTWLALLGIALGTGAIAQGLPRQAETASGPAIMTVSGDDAFVTIGGQVFTLDGAPYSSFAQQVGDLLLVAVATGGNACPTLFAWLDTRPGLVRMSEVFGTCAEGPEITWDSETITVTLRSMMPGEPNIGFVWDGRGSAVREVVLAVPTSGLPPAAGTGVWIGRHPSEWLGAPEWQDVLTQLMATQGLQDARRIVQVGHAFSPWGGWLTASGCQPHACDATMGAVALHQDGRVVVALWEQGLGLRLWGDLRGEVPPAILEVMQRR